MIKIKNSIKLFLMLSTIGLSGLGYWGILQENEKPSEIYDSQDIVGNSSSQAIVENIVSENKNYLNDPGWGENSIPTNKPSQNTVKNAVVSTATTNDQNVQSDSPQVIEKEEITVPGGRSYMVSDFPNCTVKSTKTINKEILLQFPEDYSSFQQFVREGNEVGRGFINNPKEIIKVLECEKNSIEGVIKKFKTKENLAQMLTNMERLWEEDQKYQNQEGKYWGGKKNGSGRSQLKCLVEVIRPENFENDGFGQIPKNCPSK